MKRYTGEIFNKGDVVSGLPGEIVVVIDYTGIFLPSGKGLTYRLHLFQVFAAGLYTQVSAATALPTVPPPNRTSLSVAGS